LLLKLLQKNCWNLYPYKYSFFSKSGREQENFAQGTKNKVGNYTQWLVILMNLVAFILFMENMGKEHANFMMQHLKGLIICENDSIGKMQTFTACSADLRAWSTCSTLLNSLYNFKGKVATSPTAYTPVTLVLKNASVCNQTSCA
jgi:hypothetical protein